MKDHTPPWNDKPLVLTTNEQILHNDFAQNPLSARHAIWAYVEQDIPIPNELKPILLEVLQEPFKGKSTAITKRYWTLLIQEVIFMVAEEGINQTDAIERVAERHGVKVDTLTRRYNDGNFRNLRSAMIQHLLQDAE
ncbi:hypothetical protein [Marinobacterium sediminicola]|uniref:Homeodomain-like domain-containing protein n=1 Tax=Marinobacterium sediminicola TaxID=518898 RepID=A0ABY1S305_9GAMM|nr:hypothetical protein [Marinobacterium sediminicola]ULG69298.1 hypothetical protein LN244_00350 [Marinobacterium sediminicola]SMR77649.1 hypothetical protein SAMN04487964_11567 [Marinobacterium sediminicola]